MDNDNISDVARGESTIKPDQRLVIMLQALRNFVDNPAARPALMIRGGGIFAPFDKEMPQVIKYNGFEIGYKLTDPPGNHMTRTAFVLYEDQPISEIPENELEPVLTAVLATLMDNMVKDPSIYSPGDTYKRPDGKKSVLNRHMIIIEQHFIPVLLTERKPRQKLPNITGNPTFH